VAEEIGKILHKPGLVDTPGIAQFEKEYVEKYLYGEANKTLREGGSRCVTNRSREMGWNPTHPAVYETLEQEFKYFTRKR